MLKKTLWPAIVLAFAFSGTAASMPLKHHNTRPGCPKTFTVPMVKRAVYWTYRGVRDVSRHDRKVVDRIVRCERFPRSERYVLEIKKNVISRWRQRRYENRFTPYGNWAIPSYIVACESGGQNLSPNSAGASGYYQIIPSTWASYGGLQYGPAAYESSKLGQDIIASRIWADGSGANQWVCA